MSDIDNNSTDFIEEPENNPIGEDINASESKRESDAFTSKTTRLTGMYKEWFLDYASYVILERAVPHIDDGLKPVQRRILHSMKRLDDGRFNKVANIIGYTMQYHPHGDASIGDALVQIGQKELVIDTQGNWGNILTGDNTAAPKYIKTRLSKFANIVIFNPKTTSWKLTYDGRNKEPITLPVKFPILLLFGVEGIAVGLASKILPHNFNEIIDACVLHLQNKDFELYPDFPTGGFIDCTKYNDGLRGGAIKVRAKISKLDKKTLAITELPFTKNTGALIDSIIKANEKGKIKIRKIDDNTSENVELILHLHPGTSPDKTIDALYAFTDCELSISPNACVIQNNKPRFLTVKDILRHNTDHTLSLLKMELQIRLNELNEDWHFSSLEKIFIEKRIYRDIEECETWEAVIEAIDKGLTPYKKLFYREITREDIVRLTEIKIKRISKYDAFAADKQILAIETEIDEVKNHLNNIVDYTINWFRQLKKQFGKGLERKTEIRNFESIQATKVVEANEKLYVDRDEGFFGMGLKKNEFVCECSDIDDIIVILRDGSYTITKVSDKAFFGKNIIHIAVFQKNDDRTIYNAIYRDGKYGPFFIKRFAITGITRDKHYNITQGKEGSRIMHLTVNNNGEAEIIKVFLKPKPKLKKLVMEVDFSTITIKGRNSIGNIVTKNEVHKVTIKEKGVSTLGGINIYFDEVTRRLNSECRGKLLGEFLGDDKIIIITASGNYKLYNYDLETHFEEDLIHIAKYDPKIIYSAVFFDGEQESWYLKRFNAEASEKLTSFIGDHQKSKLDSFSTEFIPQLEVIFGGKHKDKENLVINTEEFIGVKSFKARGKRISTNTIAKFNWIEPIQADYPIEEKIEEIITNENDDDSNMNGAKQMTLKL